jgi:hypothetical protein
MLNDEESEEIRQFISSPTAERLFEQLQASVIAEWMLAENLVDRERCWLDLQALQRLQTMLRDAPAMKRLDQRHQGRRVYTT